MVGIHITAVQPLVGCIRSVGLLGPFIPVLPLIYAYAIRYITNRALQSSFPPFPYLSGHEVNRLKPGKTVSGGPPYLRRKLRRPQDF